MLKKISFRVIIQILAAIFLFSLPLFILSGQNFSSVLTSKVIFPYLLFCSCFVLIYILHSYFLFPKLYASKRYTLYFISIMAILAVILFARPFDALIFRNSDRPYPNEMRLPPPDHRDGDFFKHKNDFPPHKGSPKGPKIDIASVFLFLLIIIISITKETNKQLQLTTQRALQAEAEKVQAELSFLKAQVNPHFLFNTLNNIYTLAIIKDDNTGPSIMKLSNLMRYITDEAGNDLVSLQSEIDCITDFIALQKLRITKKTSLQYELNGDFEGKQIAPLILMAFVENVFKYGISNHSASNLLIKINVENCVINFFCQNTIFPEKKNTERTGIGLENTKQRLKFIYADKHILNIADNDGYFTVNLIINLC